MRKRWTISHEIAFLTLAVLVPYLVLGAYWALEAVEEAREQIKAEALGSARLVAADIDRLLGDSSRLATTIAAAPSVRTLDRAAIQPYLREVLDQQAAYDDLFVADASGTVIADAGAGAPDPLENVSDRPYFQKAMASGQVVTGEVRRLDPSSPQVVVVAAPIHGVEGRLLGVVGARLSLERLAGLVTRHALPRRSTVTILDGQGTVLARNLNPRGWIGENIGDRPIVQYALKERRGTLEGEFGDGVVRLSGFDTATRAPWLVLVGIPSTDAYAPLQREAERMLVRLLLVALATIILAHLVSRRISRPIRSLAAAAGLLGTGHLHHRVPPQRTVELDALAATLNQMASDLEAHVRALESSHQRLVAAVHEVGGALNAAEAGTDLAATIAKAARALVAADEAEIRLGEAGATETAMPGPDEATRLAVLLRSDGTTLGLLTVSRAEGPPFSEHERSLLGAFASQAGIALENARLRQETVRLAAVRELNRLQGEFISTASHQLLTPVTSIKSYAELLLRLDPLRASPVARECAERIDSLSDRVARLVRDLLSASRLGSDQLTLSLAPVELVALARQMLGDLQPTAPRHHLRLEAPAEPVVVRADAHRLGEALANVLANAIIYSPEGGEVVVRVGAAAASEGGPGDQEATLEVVDHGIGIAPEELPHVFDRFVRGQRAMHTAPAGLGLGLFVARRYLEAMGGRISIASAPGEGTTASLRLPLARESPGGGARPAGAASSVEVSDGKPVPVDSAGRR